jgi:hypothetical protein
VFFDPDNGIETASVPKIHQKAGKYIYSDELGEFWKRGNALNLPSFEPNQFISSAS